MLAASTALVALGWAGVLQAPQLLGGTPSARGTTSQFQPPLPATDEILAIAAILPLPDQAAAAEVEALQDEIAKLLNQAEELEATLAKLEAFTEIPESPLPDMPAADAGMPPVPQPAALPVLAVASLRGEGDEAATLAPLAEVVLGLSSEVPDVQLAQREVPSSPLVEPESAPVRDAAPSFEEPAQVEREPAGQPEGDKGADAGTVELVDPDAPVQAASPGQEEGGGGPAEEASPGVAAGDVTRDQGPSVTAPETRDADSPPVISGLAPDAPGHAAPPRAEAQGEEPRAQSEEERAPQAAPILAAETTETPAVITPAEAPAGETTTARPPAPEAGPALAPESTVREEAPTAAPPEAAQREAASTSPPAPQARPSPPVLSPEERLAILRRAEEKLAFGEVAAARLLYQQAAQAGSGRAAAALGRTYEPDFLAGIGAQGVAPDPLLAAVWARRAEALGLEPQAAAPAPVPGAPAFVAAPAAPPVAPPPQAAPAVAPVAAPPAPAPAAPPAPAAMPAPTPPPAPAQEPSRSLPAPRNAPAMAPEGLEAVIRRADEMLALRDISAARRLYGYAAEAGSGRAAAALGRTYDPAFLGSIGAQGIRPDPVLARHWYQRATALGEAVPRAPEGR